VSWSFGWVFLTAGRYLFTRLAYFVIYHVLVHVVCFVLFQFVSCPPMHLSHPFIFRHTIITISFLRSITADSAKFDNRANAFAIMLKFGNLFVMVANPFGNSKYVITKVKHKLRISQEYKSEALADNNTWDITTFVPLTKLEYYREK
jgi:hypothetical protein